MKRLAALVCLACAARAQDEPNPVEEALKRMADVYSLVEQNAAAPVDPNHAFYEGALPSMLRKLDPHSVFFTPGQFDQLRDMQRSETKGFGTVVSILPGRVIVLQTLEGTPSARAGLQPGDEIVAVNNIRLDLLTADQLIGLLSESRRAEAVLIVRRTTSPRLLEFHMKPEAMTSPSVDRAFLLRPQVGYVRITSFEGETGKQLKAAIEKLGGGALKALVLDLRGNPGGIITVAVEAASLFLPPGQVVVTTRGRAKANEDLKTPENGTPYTFPLAVLVDEKSASSSEIVAGAMQDYGRGKLIGTRTFGKGLVQSIFPLAQGTGMALTTAFYFTPKGRLIQRMLTEGQLATYGEGGLKPDIEVTPEPATRLRAFLDLSAMFTTFATEYVKSNNGITAGFEVSNELLDKFQAFLADRKVSPGVNEWSREREWIRSRLQQDILNQAVGVDKGDEVEMQRDVQVKRALIELGVL
ncbi:MAG: S41 family peptidase [Acidobacteriota bacterium]